MSQRIEDMVKEMLCEIIEQRGKAVCDDSKYCKNLLNDYCRGEGKREIAVLTTAIKEGVADELSKAVNSCNIPVKVTINQLVKRMHENHGVDSKVARWAVEAWAEALGIETDLVPIFRPFKHLKDFQGKNRSYIHSCAFSPDGVYMASGGTDKTLTIWDIRKGTESNLFTFGGWVNTIATHPKNNMVAAGCKDGCIYIRSWSGGTSMTEVINGHLGSVSSVAFSPNGEILVSASFDGKVRLWDTHSKNAINIIETLIDPTRTSPIRAVAFSPDGTWIASAGHHGIITLSNAEDGSEILRLNGHIGQILCLAFSPDSSLIASGGTDRTIRLWDSSSGTERMRLEGHTSAINALAFRPQTRSTAILASCSDDKSIRFWENDKGTELQHLDKHTGEVQALGFSLDGNKMVSGGKDGVLRLWDSD